MKSEKKDINLPILISNVDICNSWDEWLEKNETSLKEIGYRKFNQNHKREDFAYWKSFYINEEKAYQVGLLFYDFRKYQKENNTPERIGVQFECMFINIDSRIDLSVSKEITIEEFEEMSRTFYDAMVKFSK